MEGRHVHLLFFVEPNQWPEHYCSAASDCCIRLFGRFLPRLRPPSGGLFLMCAFNIIFVEIDTAYLAVRLGQMCWTRVTTKLGHPEPPPWRSVQVTASR